jgi:hypothetical protein
VLSRNTNLVKDMASTFCAHLCTNTDNSMADLESGANESTRRSDVKALHNPKIGYFAAQRRGLCSLGILNKASVLILPSSLRESRRALFRTFDVGWLSSLDSGSSGKSRFDTSNSCESHGLIK